MACTGRTLDVTDITWNHLELEQINLNSSFLSGLVITNYLSKNWKCLYDMQDMNGLHLLPVVRECYHCRHLMLCSSLLLIKMATTS